MTTWITPKRMLGLMKSFIPLCKRNLVYDLDRFLCTEKSFQSTSFYLALIQKNVFNDETKRIVRLTFCSSMIGNLLSEHTHS
ncbi:unnamed protein product [Moneuplotes crassus]|uniref:Uncharacterized protein n=1 Tax=Euplotes crassus TaxID=5936 RepID=A0AAD2D7C8_EUPCR|nr:unnamed protein product [Moneuplotes crassus]